MHLQEKKYLKENREKILSLSRELLASWEITEQTMEEVYYNNFIKK